MASEVEIRAEQSRQLLENPVFKTCFFGVQVKVIDDIQSTPPEERDRLSQLALKLQVIEEVRGELLEAIETQQLEFDEARHREPPENPNLR